MGATGRYLSYQFKKQKLFLEHDNASDFYVSCWQRNRAALPLLCIRLVMFLGCLAILLASLILTTQSLGFKFWAIYMTHWGLICITLTTASAFAISCIAYFKGSIEAISELPWYVKTYWVLYNISVTLAFFITIFYYSFLTNLEVDYAMNAALDFFIHGANSIIMFVMLITSRHTSNMLHFYHPVLFASIYAIFSAIYYATGGTDPFGNHFIYPMLDWSSPGITIGLVAIIAVTLIVVFLVTLVLAGLRNFLTGRYRSNSRSCAIS